MEQQEAQFVICCSSPLGRAEFLGGPIIERLASKSPDYAASSPNLVIARNLQKLVRKFTMRDPSHYDDLEACGHSGDNRDCSGDDADNQ